jgi:hypothetical protein
MIDSPLMPAAPFVARFARIHPDGGSTGNVMTDRHAGWSGTGSPKLRSSRRYPLLATIDWRNRYAKSIPTLRQNRVRSLT